MEEGKYQETDRGTPQGGIISPVLANIYLHYVLDLWFEKEPMAKENPKCHRIQGVVAGTEAETSRTLQLLWNKWEYERATK